MRSAAPVGKKRSALRKFLLQPRTLLWMALVLLVAAFLIADSVFPLRYAASYRQSRALPPRAEGEMRVHFLDVGQGDCTVMEFPDGKVMMVDGGDGSAASRSAVIGYCMALGIERFDHILLTHTDADHAAGLEDVFRQFGADTAFLPFVPAEDAESAAAYARVQQAAQDCGARLCTAQTYEYLLSSDREHFYYLLFLAPLPGTEFADANAASAIVWLEYAGVSLLLTGDAPEQAENALVRSYLETGGEVFALPVQAYGETFLLAPRLSSLTVLKAGHHGSNSSTGEALLSLCTPEAVVFSAGAGNRYEHPAAACIARIRTVLPDAELYRTDELGTVVLSVSATGERKFLTSE